MKFFKTQALANDMVFIDESEVCIVKNMREFVRFLSNRKRGVGCDQVVFFDYKKDAIRMKFFNPDGSEAEMCGNALLSSGVLFKELYGISHFNAITKSGSHNVYTNNHVTVKIGIPDFSINHEISHTFFGCVKIGNPHISLFFKENGYVSDELVNSLGHKLEHSVEDGINVGFATINNNEIFLKVWERGAGFTGACGSGACAAAVISKKLNIIDNNGEIKVHQIGGDLAIRVDNDNFQITMIGMAKFVFSGDIEWIE